jgi:hypothetical protein
MGIILFGSLALVGLIFFLFLCEFLKECEWQPNTALKFFKGECGEHSTMLLSGWKRQKLPFRRS